MKREEGAGNSVRFALVGSAILFGGKARDEAHPLVHFLTVENDVLRAKLSPLSLARKKARRRVRPGFSPFTVETHVLRPIFRGHRFRLQKERKKRREERRSAPTGKTRFLQERRGIQKNPRGFQTFSLFF